MHITPITIDNGRVTIHSAGAVWMTRSQLADLFGVFTPAIEANIRSVFKNEVLRESDVRREMRHRDGSTTTFYNLEMIVALAFRLKSRKAEQFRRWIVQQAATPIVLWDIPRMDELPN